MRLLIDDDSTCSKDRACAQQPDKTVATHKSGPLSPSTTSHNQPSRIACGHTNANLENGFSYTLNAKLTCA